MRLEEMYSFLDAFNNDMVYLRVLVVQGLK